MNTILIRQFFIHDMILLKKKIQFINDIRVSAMLSMSIFKGCYNNTPEADMRGESSLGE